ncbi:hypothetical protein EXIGLDRAFT_696487 [Exidia glandulosa HHB12029]|uniref:DUF6532 domain-containing protein n=1 Tax=Exidia glandulosa HHB12029 TaxID=1314781 RepID=A0A165FB19_EXIGL|nr:hypothetical protein EXIGLDRAFT_696487 [Exidia glandulosa HHB12029]
MKTASKSGSTAAKPAKATSAKAVKVTKVALSSTPAAKSVGKSKKAPTARAVVRPARPKQVFPHSDEEDDDDDVPSDGMDDEEAHSDKSAEEHDSDRMDQEEEEEEDDDDDEEPAPLEPAKRKRRTIELSSSDPVLVSRPNKKSKTPLAKPAASDQFTTPKANRVHQASSGTGTEQTFTPYNNHGNPRDPSKPLLTKQSPQTQSIVKRAAHQYRALVVTKTPFVPDPDRNTAASKVFMAAAQDLDAMTRILRFEADEVYQDHVIKMIKRADSQVRGEVVSAARDIVGSSYGLGPGFGSQGENKAYVELLVTDLNFVFRIFEVENVNGQLRPKEGRSGPYRHPIFATLVQQEFFNSHEAMATAGPTTALFNPMPLVVIAFAATAVQCALKDWATGVRVKSSSDFSHDEWAPVFDLHLKQLEHFRDQQPEKINAWTRKLWKDCWSTTRQSLAAAAPAQPSMLTAAEMDDFGDVDDL